MGIYKNGHVDPVRPVVEDPARIAALKAEYSATVRPDAAAALRISKRTELNAVFQKVVIIRDYGQGVVEIGYSNPPTPNQNDVDRRTEEQKKPRDKDHVMSDANLSRSLRRSKATIRRKCMAAGLDYLLTLTYRENVKDIERSHRDLTRFLRLVRVRLPKYHYVCVREYQSRGAVHFHLAVKGFQNVALLRSIWWSIVGDGDGNVDVQERKGGRTGSLWELAKIACYISKYITKDSIQAFGKQRYSVSEGIEIPRRQALVSFPVGVDMLTELFDSLGARLKFRFQDAMGFGWACSW